MYIVTSEDKRYYDWIPSMVYSLFFDELYHLTAIDPTLHETLPVHLTFLMDEFANGVTRSTPKTVGITDKSVA